LYPGDVPLDIKEADAVLNPCVRISELEIIACFCFVVVWKLVYKSRVKLQQVYSASESVHCPFWEQHKQELWEEKTGQDFILSGGGRNDLPGHCVQYSTYSLADMEDNTILQMNIVDVRDAAGKSNNMEQIGFVRGMDKLLASQMSINWQCPPGRPEIGKWVTGNAPSTTSQFHWPIIRNMHFALPSNEHL
jgi:hypothetical protein